MTQKATDIWNAPAVEQLRLAMGLGTRGFRQSYEGVKAAVEYKGREDGVVLLTTKEEFDQLPVPIDNEGRQRFDRRKIKLLRKGVEFKDVSIQDFLSGHMKCLTEEEKREFNTKQSEAAKKRLPKGVATSNDQEREAILALNRLLKLSQDLIYKEALEFRQADALFCRRGEEADGFVADQVKSAQVQTTGRFQFNLTVGRLYEYLTARLSVTCIGMVGTEVAVVYYFTPTRVTLDALGLLSSEQTINPMLRLKQRSNNEFTAFLAQYKYEVGRDFTGSAAAIERLRLAKLDFCDTGVKRSYEFWNFDVSQVTSDSHKTELASLLRTRNAVTLAGSTCEKLPGDNYGPVDFRLAGARVQDKVVDSDTFQMCVNGVPYDPDSIDCFMFSEVTTGDRVGLAPMRQRANDGTVKCFFSPKELSKPTIRVSNDFNAKVEWFERSNSEDMQRLVKRCAECAAVPPVTRTPAAE